MNDTVQCDGGLYKSLQAWKDHKLHIEHEVLIQTLPQLNFIYIAFQTNST